MAVDFVTVPFQGREIQLEYQWINATERAAPLMVFLHEGLGSLAMWRDYPQRLCDAGGFRGLVYSRYGYGRSTPRPHAERWPVDYLQRQAHTALPAFLRAVGADAARPWLFGHSDGGSIALLFAAAYPEALSGAVVVAPHIFVEDVTVEGIQVARERYQTSDVRRRLGSYHADPDSAFWGWNDAWLTPSFRDWNIEDALPSIRCPLLAVQGYQDEYATMAQLDGIKAGVPQAQLLKLEDCGHSPHRDQPEALLAATIAFVRGRGRST